MIFSCDRCGRRYSVPDERVHGRAFRVTCKACANVIVVRPAAQPQVAPLDATQPEATAPSLPLPRPAPAAAPAVAPRPQPISPPPRAALAPSAPVAASFGAEDPASFGAEEPASFGAEDPASFGAEEPASFGADAAAAATVVRPRAEPDDRRGLTSAEMAWMSDRAEPQAVSAPTAVPGSDFDLPDADVDEPEPRRTGGPGLPRLLLAAVILGLAATGAVALLWPYLHPAVEPQQRPPPVAVQPKPPPPPPPPSPQDVQPPPPAPAPEPQDTAPPAKVVEPAKTSSRASFEPGTVKVARAKKKEAHTLSKKDRKLLDLLDRKKDAGAPPEPVEALDLDSGRSLDPAAVERVVAESQGAFSGCISRRGRVGTREHATLLLTVDASGAVAAAWVAEADVSKSPLGRCLVTAGKRLVFPAFEGDSVDVSVPLLLEAR